MPLLEDRMHELDRDVLGVARAAAVAEHEQPATLRERIGHRPGAPLDRGGVLGEERLDQHGALVRLASRGSGEVRHGACSSPIRGFGRTGSRR